MACAVGKLVEGRGVIFFNLSKILHRWNVYVVDTRLIIGSARVIAKAWRMYIPFYNVFSFFYGVMFKSFFFLTLTFNALTLIDIKYPVVSKKRDFFFFSCIFIF